MKKITKCAGFVALPLIVLADFLFWNLVYGRTHGYVSLRRSITDNVAHWRSL